MKKIIIYMLIITTVICLGSFSFTLGGVAETGEIVNAGVDLKIGDYILLGKYDDDPILWRCVDIDKNGPLILSDKVICFKPFDVAGTKGSHKRNKYDSLDGQRVTRGSNYWGDSNIRSWLNSVAEAGKVEWLCGNPPGPGLEYAYQEYNDEKGFLADGNFTVSERMLFKEVKQKSLLDEFDSRLATSGSRDGWGHPFDGIGLNSIMARYDNICAEEITDRVFLIDYMQVNNIYQNTNVLGDYLLACPTQKAVDYVAEKGFAHMFTKPEHDKPILYFMRSPAYVYLGSRGDWRTGRGYSVATLEERNVVSIDSSSANLNYGIRPAFYLNEANAVILSGSGTEDDPYVVDGNPDVGSEDISVFINGTRLEFDQPPIMENDRVLVPFRAIFESLGAVVDWDDDTRIVTAVKDGTKITLKIGSNILYKSNGEAITLDVPAKLYNSRILVPIRAVSEALGAVVEWDDDTQTVIIKT